MLAGDSAKPTGLGNAAAVASAMPRVAAAHAVPPLPATATMVPFGSTARTLPAPASATYTAPVGATTTATGFINAAAVAGPPLPVEADTPLPANSAKKLAPGASDTVRMRRLPASATRMVVVFHTASPCGLANVAFTSALVPSPE